MHKLDLLATFKFIYQIIFHFISLEFIKLHRFANKLKEKLKWFFIITQLYAPGPKLGLIFTSSNLCDLSPMYPSLVLLYVLFSNPLLFIS